MSDQEVQRRTNFLNESHFLSFVVIVCNGEFELITETNSYMTWYEEWFFTMEYLWGRTLCRWRDASSPNEYGVTAAILRNVFDKKCLQILMARNSWSVHVTHTEDVELRGNKWNDRYGNKRVIQWDNTNVNLVKMSESGLQRATYSNYYGQNCAKGGIFLQLSGWMGMEELWEGADVIRSI